MSGFFKKIEKVDPLGRYVNHKDPILRNVNQGLGLIRNPTIPPPGPPDQDTAANAAALTQDAARRRRGVMANVFAGGSAGAPSTASKSTLG